MKHIANKQYVVDQIAQSFWSKCLFAVTQILAVFVKMFKKSRDENEKLADAEKKKVEKEAMKDRTSTNSFARKDGVQQIDFRST